MDTNVGLCRSWYWITSRKRVWSRKTPSTSSKQQGQTMPALEMSSFSSKYSLFRSPWVDIKGRGRRGNSIIYHVWGTVGGAVFTWIAEGMCAWSVNIIFDLLILSHCFYFRMKQRKRALFDRCMIDSARREMIYGVLSLLEIYCLGGWTAASVCITLTGCEIIQKYIPKQSHPSDSTDLSLLVSYELFWTSNPDF